MEGRVEDERVGLSQSCQPPHRLSGAQSAPCPAGQALRVCHPGRGQQAFRLPGEVFVRPGGLLAEAGQIALGGAVGCAKGRQRAVAQAVAGVVVGLVGLVCHPRLPAGAANGLGVGPGQAEQGPQVARPAGPDARRAVEARSPGQPEQQRLGLITSSMGRCDGVYPLCQQPPEAGVPQTARPVLPGLRPAHLCFQLSGMEDPQRQTQPGAGLPDEGLVPVGCFPTQAVVDMADRECDAVFLGQWAHEAEQRHAVRPARDGQRDLPPALQQTLPGAEAAHRLQNFFARHQRLKSTSMNRVWAPSQPSGTVLVSP